MSIEEIKEQIKNEIVLREGNVFTWQWRQLGLLAKAETLAISEDEFLVLVNEVSRNLNPYFGRISDLKVAIGQIAQRQNNQLTQEQISQYIEQAQPLQLSAIFVSAYWIPAIVATLPKSADSTPPSVESSPSNISLSSVAASPSSVQKAEDTPLSTDPAQGVMIKKVRSFLDNTQGHVPASLLKELFLSTDYDQTQLAKLINGYLTIHNYTADVPTRGKTLTQQLLSTDWRLEIGTAVDNPILIEAQVETANDKLSLNQTPINKSPAANGDKFFYQEVAVIGVAMVFALAMMVYSLSGKKSKIEEPLNVYDSTMSTDTTMVSDSVSESWIDSTSNTMSADSAK